MSEHTTLGALCELIVDSEHKTAPTATLGPEYGHAVGTPHIRNGRILLGNAKPVDEATYRKWTVRETPRDGDLILAREAPVGQVGRIVGGQRLCLGQRTVLLRPDSEVVHSRYLQYMLLSPAYQESMHSMAAGSTVPHLNIKDIRSLAISELPTLSDQQAIAEVLGALDDKITINERIRATSLELSEAQFVAVEASTYPSVGEVAEVYDGPHATPKKTEDGPWFLSISSLKNGFLDLDESAHLAEEDFPKWTRRVQPMSGDVLFSYETRLGDAALMPPGVRGSLGRRMALLRAKSDDVSGALLLHAYLSPPFQEEIRRRTIHGATVDRIPLKEMPNWQIPLPAPEDRPELSSTLESLHGSVIQAAQENQTLAELRDTLLPKLISGQIRIKDAERAVEEAV